MDRYDFWAQELGLELGLDMSSRAVVAAALREAAAEAYEDAATMNCCVECSEGAEDMRAKAAALRVARLSSARGE